MARTPEPSGFSLKTLAARLSKRLPQAPQDSAYSLFDLRHLAEQAIRNLPALTAPAGRLIHAGARGAHGRRRAGPGDSFWQYRSFSAGDMQADVDWRRSARSDHLFVRQKEWESAQNAFFWCDHSPSMRYRSKTSLPSKQDHAIALTLALALLLNEGGERLGYLSQLQENSSHGKAALERLMTRLSADRDQRDQARAQLPSPPKQRHAHALLISDFLVPEDDLRRTISQFADHGIKGQLVHVLDPAEIDFPFRGRLKLMDLESDHSVLLMQAEASRGTYRRNLDAWRDTLAQLAKDAGWGYHLHQTHKPLTPTILALHMALEAGAPTISSAAAKKAPRRVQL